MHSITELANVTGFDREIGFKRLGVALLESMKLQGLSTRDVAKITKRVFGDTINKDNVSKICNGFVHNPEINTYRRLTPLLFRVNYFQCSEANPVGKPVFDYRGEKYEGLKLTNLINFHKSVSEFPDLEYRYRDYRDLLDIVRGKIPMKTVFSSFIRS